MLPYQIIQGGSFTHAVVANPQDLIVQSIEAPDFFWMRNRTQWGAGTAQRVEWMWHNGMAQGTGQVTVQTVGTNVLSSLALASDGISFYDTANPPSFPSLACTAITNANPAVVSMANTGTIRPGDVVRVINVTGMQQISGLLFEVTAVTTNTSITLALDASAGNGFAAPGTNGFIKKVIPNRFYPKLDGITKISQAAQAVVTFAVSHTFTAGEFIGLRVPTGFGMVEADLQDARVLSTTQFTVTLDLDTTGYTAWTWPASAIPQINGFAHAVPSSSGVVPFAGSATVPAQPPGTNLLDAFDNRNVRVIHLGGSVFTNTTAGDVFDWYVMKFDLFS